MKKVFFLLFLVLLAKHSFAQSYNLIGLPNNASDAECREYFNKHLLELDPIEGFYDVSITQIGQNAFRTFPAEKHSYTLAIVRGSDGAFHYLRGNSVTINRVGETNVYNFTHHWSTGDVVTRVYLTDGGLRYIRNHEIPTRELKAQMGHEYQAGMRVFLQEDAIKTFPTSSEISRAITENKRRSEEQKPKNWSGSGFALNNGYIVTNYHVVEGAGSITVTGIDNDFNTYYSATVSAYDTYNDLAILHISDYRFTGFGTIPYAIKSNNADVGENIFVMGYPLTATMGDEIKYTNGVISSNSGFQGDISLYQITAPIQPGNSGGPLFDNQGNVIGVVSSKHIGAENVGYAIKASYLLNLIQSRVSSSITPQTNRISSMSRTDQIKNIKRFVYIIKCSSSKSSNYSYSGSSSSSRYSYSSESTYQPSNSNKSSSTTSNTKVESLSQQELLLGTGQSYQLHAYPKDDFVTKWESDNSNVATVSSSGLVQGISPGVVLIWAYYNLGVKKCKVTVYDDNIQAITCNNKEITLPIGQSVRITGTTAVDKVSEWESHNPKVATVSSAGVVTAISPGRAIIWVHASSGLADVTIIVPSIKQVKRH